MLGFGFTSDWLKKWCENFEPITEWRNAKPKHFANYFRHSIENRFTVLNKVLSLRYMYVPWLTTFLVLLTKKKKHSNREKMWNTVKLTQYKQVVSRRQCGPVVRALASRSMRSQVQDTFWPLVEFVPGSPWCTFCNFSAALVTTHNSPASWDS